MVKLLQAERNTKSVSLQGTRCYLEVVPPINDVRAPYAVATVSVRFCAEAPNLGQGAD